MIGIHSSQVHGRMRSNGSSRASNIWCRDVKVSNEFLQYGIRRASTSADWRTAEHQLPAAIDWVAATLCALSWCETENYDISRPSLPRDLGSATARARSVI